LLDVLELLVQAAREDRELHGYLLMRETKRVGPTIYNVLDKLEDMAWITGRFEERNLDHPGKPPRRFYRLTGEAVPQAEALLRERRPGQVRPSRKLGWAQLIIGVCRLDGA
jgi:PadR family transcriptional regulator PadR